MLKAGAALCIIASRDRERNEGGPLVWRVGPPETLERRVAQPTGREVQRLARRGETRSPIRPLTRPGIRQASRRALRYWSDYPPTAPTSTSINRHPPPPRGPKSGIAFRGRAV